MYVVCRGQRRPARSSWPLILPVLVLSVLHVRGLQSRLAQFVGYGFIIFGHLSVVPQLNVAGFGGVGDPWAG